MTVQDVLAAASQLSQYERLQVAIHLLESLRESYPVPQLPKPDPSQDFQALNSGYLEEKCSLHSLLSQSPLSQLDFEAESIESPVRAVEF
ncbi:hypothetical protein HC928_08475 [bacterium]|nr:hypothetical protein [bacterium]